MSDPKRMRDGAGELGMLVRAAEADVLDDDAISRVRERLAAIGVASATTMAIAKPSLLRALATKIVAVVSAGAIAGIAVAAWPSHRSASPPAMATTHTAVTRPVAAPSVAPSTMDVPSISVTDLPRSVREVHAAPLVQASPTPPPAATTPREGLLLLRARRALPTDPAHALSLVREHETEFPDSQLAPERDKIRSEAESKVAR